MSSLNEILPEKTIANVEVELWGSDEEDLKQLIIYFTDGSSLDLYAGSYCIPEEPSINPTFTPAEAG